jgi:hypothetical protein
MGERSMSNWDSATDMEYCPATLDTGKHRLGSQGFRSLMHIAKLCASIALELADGEAS